MAKNVKRQARDFIASKARQNTDTAQAQVSAARRAAALAFLTGKKVK